MPLNPNGIPEFNSWLWILIPAFHWSRPWEATVKIKDGGETGTKFLALGQDPRQLYACKNDPARWACSLFSHYLFLCLSNINKCYFWFPCFLKKFIRRDKCRGQKQNACRQELRNWKEEWRVGIERLWSFSLHNEKCSVDGWQWCLRGNMHVLNVTQLHP